MSFVPPSPITGKKSVTEISKLQSRDIVNLYREEGDIDVERFFKNTPEVSICKCNDTGYRFYYPESIIGDDTFYKELQIKSEKANESYYRSNAFDHQYTSSIISKDIRLLEIGCGDGRFLKSLLSTTKNITGIELNKYAAEVCRKEGLEVYDELIGEHSKKRESYYDMICCFQVLEHIYDIRSFIDDTLRALKPGGQFVISVPNNEPYFLRYNKYETFNLPPHHMGLWNFNVFKSLEHYFPIKLKHVEYSASYKLKVDIYYRAKSWANIKTVLYKHTLREKAALALLFPFSVVISFADLLRKKIHGTQICVVFEKNKI